MDLLSDVHAQTKEAQWEDHSLCRDLSSSVDQGLQGKGSETRRDQKGLSEEKNFLESKDVICSLNGEGIKGMMIKIVLK